MNTIINTTKHTLEIPLSDTRRKLIYEILLLYQCQPNPKSYCNFNVNSKFQDPLCDARNLKEIQAQFNAMPKVFSKSITKSCNVIKNDKYNLHFDLIQEYTFTLIGYTKLMISTTVLELDANNKIINFEDRWNHKDSWRNGSIFTYSTNLLRRINAIVLPYFVNT